MAELLLRLGADWHQQTWRGGTEKAAALFKLGSCDSKASFLTVNPGITTGAGRKEQPSLISSDRDAQEFRSKSRHSMKKGRREEEGAKDGEDMTSCYPPKT